MMSIILALIITYILLKLPLTIGSQKELNSGNLSSVGSISQCSFNISFSNGDTLITEIFCSINVSVKCNDSLIQIKNICNGKFYCYCAAELNNSTKYHQQETEEINNNLIIHQVNYSCKLIKSDALTVFDMTKVVSTDLNDNKGYQYHGYDTNTSDHCEIQCRVESNNNMFLDILYADGRSDCHGKIYLYKDNVSINHRISESKRDSNGENNNVRGKVIFIKLQMASGLVWIELNISAAAKLKYEEVSETFTTFTAKDSTFTQEDITSFGFISQGVLAVMAVVIFIAMFYFSIIRAPKSKPKKANVKDEYRRDKEQIEAVEVNLANTDCKENENIMADYEDTRI